MELKTIQVRDSYLYQWLLAFSDSESGKEWYVFWGPAYLWYIECVRNWKLRTVKYEIMCQAYQSSKELGFAMAQPSHF
jgi:hypothetical protein